MDDNFRVNKKNKLIDKSNKMIITCYNFFGTRLIITSITNHEPYQGTQSMY